MSRPRLRALLLDALFVLAGVFVYFGVRGLTAGDPSTAMAHARDLLRLEERLGLDVEQGVQSALNGFGTLATLANWIYMVISGLMGLCVYTTYPVAPPRLSGLGLIDTVAQQSQAYRACCSMAVATSGQGGRPVGSRTIAPSRVRRQTGWVGMPSVIQSCMPPR